MVVVVVVAVAGVVGTAFDESGYKIPTSNNVNIPVKHIRNTVAVTVNNCAYSNLQKKFHDNQ